MRAFTPFSAAVLMIATAGRLPATDLGPAPPLESDQHIDAELYSDVNKWIVGDTNGIGRIDYGLKLDEQLRKAMEAVDTNHDGTIDRIRRYD